MYIVRCILELETPLHCGIQTDGLLDAPVERDAYGFWRIPGSSVAGVLRSWMRDRDAERGDGKSYEKTLFGSGDEKGDQEDSRGAETQGGQSRDRESRDSDTRGSASLVWCSDACLLDYDNTFAWQNVCEGRESAIGSPCYVRDHVRIDPDTGSAVPGGKFDEEYVPAGVRFGLEICLDGWMQKETEDEVMWFRRMLQAFRHGDMQFGGSSRWMYGMYHVDMQGRYLDLTDPRDLQAWIGLTDGVTFPEDTGTPWTIGETDQETGHRTPGEDLSSSRITGVLGLPFMTDGPILIAGGGPSEQVDADSCFATTAICSYRDRRFSETLVLPGSSVRGVIRKQVLHILKALKIGDPERELADLFGVVEHDRAACGRVGFADCLLERDARRLHKDDCTIVQHVSLDRLTGGAMDAHLFNEAPLWQKQVSFTLHVRLDGITPFQAGLLVHALLDLAEGRCAIGNGVNRGNGRVCADRSRGITWDLRWRGEHVTDRDPSAQERMRQWLSGISDALSDALQERQHAS